MLVVVFNELQTDFVEIVPTSSQPSWLAALIAFSGETDRPHREFLTRRTARRYAATVAATAARIDAAVMTTVCPHH